jgi:glycyl-tRNA synthetase alpha subunit
MSFRKKLIVLLVCLSIVPILALRTFGIHNVHLFADEVAHQVDLNFQKSSELRFNGIFQRHQQLLTQTFEKLETAFLFQTYEARRLLQTTSGCQRFTPDTNGPGPYDLVLSETTMGPPAVLHQVYSARNRVQEKTEVAGLLDAIRERTRRVEILTAYFSRCLFSPRR